MTTKFKKSFSPMLICWNDIKIHLGFEDSYFVPPPTESMAREILDSILREVMLGDENKREGTILEGDCPIEELPEMTDDVSVSHENKQPFEKIEVEGELDEVLSSKFALIQLRRGGKALLRKRRLYVEGSLPG